MRMARIFAHGDIHGQIGFNKFISACERAGLTKEDYVVVCGDFGLVWYGRGVELKLLDKLNSQPWTTLWVDGNHENFDLLGTYKIQDWKGGKVQFIRPKVIHLCRGQVFNLLDKKIFSFGGAQSVDRCVRKLGESMWEQEVPSESDFMEGKRNLAKHNYRVDFIFSHTCPRFLVPLLLLGGFEDWDLTTEYLDYFATNTEYKGWWFGHWHRYDELIDARGIKHTVLYNDLVLVYDDSRWSNRYIF